MERNTEKFYDNFHPKIEDVEEHADRATGERLLGVDPKSGKMFTLEWEDMVR